MACYYSRKYDLSKNSAFSGWWADITCRLRRTMLFRCILRFPTHGRFIRTLRYYCHMYILLPSLMIYICSVGRMLSIFPDWVLTLGGYQSVHVQGSIYWGGGGGGKDSPPNTPASPPKFLPMKSYSVLAKSLSAIPQLLGPQNCLRMPQNHSQKAQNSKKFWGGMPPDPPRELWPMGATPIHCHFPPPPPPNQKL